MIIWASLLIALLAAPAGAAQGWRAIDGDTIATPRGERVRLWGIDTPEMPKGAIGGAGAQCQREADLGLAAQSEVARLLAEARRVRIDRREVHEKYGRTLADVWVSSERRGVRWRSVSAHLLSMGLARPYLGRGKRPDWCSS